MVGAEPSGVAGWITSLREWAGEKALMQRE
jgi:hypothetical protein